MTKTYEFIQAIQEPSRPIHIKYRLINIREVFECKEPTLFSHQSFPHRQISLTRLPCMAV